MDAYVFLSNADRSTIANLTESTDHRIRLVIELAGAYDALVALEVQNVRDLKDVMLQEVRGAGHADTDTAIAVQPSAAAAIHQPTAIRRWFVASAVEGYTRIHCRRGHVLRVFEEIQKLDGFLGASLVAGRYDIALGVGGQTYDEVSNVVLSQLESIDGIASTVSSFASNEPGDSTS
jgi:hypothetical protein